MQTQVINAPVGAIFLSDFLTELPKGIFNKVETGCGMTSLALRSETPYIVAVPFTHLIVNKCSQEKQVFPFHGNVSKTDFKEFLLRGGKKVMVTYDSLPKLSNWIKETGVNPYTTFRLLVDEYQVLLSQYKLRESAFIQFTDESLQYEYTTFGSATPLTAKFTPAPLNHLDITEIHWPESIVIKVTRQKSSRPLSTVKKLVKAYASGAGIPFNGVISERGIFFLNSVRSIASLIKACELKPEQVTVICGKNQRNKEVLGDFYGTIDVANANTPVTFVTSSGWQGIDIYSENALSYVVSDVSQEQTLVDITTSVIQAAGRVRNMNNPFKGQLVHIFNTGFGMPPKRLEGQSEEDYQQALQMAYKQEDDDFNAGVEMLIKSSKSRLMFYDNMTQSELNDYMNFQVKHDLRELIPFVSALCINGNWRVFFDEVKVQIERFQYEMIQKVYRDGLTLRRAYAEAGFDVSKTQLYDNPQEKFERTVLSLSFRDAFVEYPGADEQRKTELIALFPLIKEAIEVLGAERCGTLKYVKKDIVNEIQAKTGDVAREIRTKLVKRFEHDQFVSNKQLKAALEEIYSGYISLCKVKPKASDILTYCPQSIVGKQSVNGKRENGYVIQYDLALRFMINSKK